MASFLDISGLDFFSSIFTFLLIFVVIYSLLTYGKILGENKGLHALIAVSIALLFMFSKDAIELVNFVVPWFTIMFILIILMIMAYTMFNPGANIFELLAAKDRHKLIVYWIITLSVIIILMGLGRTYGEKVGPYLDEDGNTVSSDGTNIASNTAENFRGAGDVATDDWATNVGATIFHPKMLAIIFMLLLGTFTILLLARN